MKNKVVIVVVSLVFILAIALILKSHFDNSKKGGKKHDLMDDNLYTLYLDDLSNEKLKKLITFVDKKAGNKYLNKLVFQFYSQKGQLTLAMYAGGKNHQGFENLGNVVLKISEHIENNSGGLNLYLGDLEIKNQDINWEELKGYFNPTSSHKVVVFRPEVINAPHLNDRDEWIIRYHIDTAVQIPVAGTVYPSKWNSIVTNPSPPYNGN